MLDVVDAVSLGWYEMENWDAKNCIRGDNNGL